MSDLNNFVISVALFVCSLLLMSYFVEYKIEPIRFTRSTRDVVFLPENEIVHLGLTTIPPERGSLLAKYHGRIGAQRGIFARSGYPKLVAAIGGLLAPAMLALIAVYLCARGLIRTVKKYTNVGG